jgi:hypothetical protein
MTFTLLRDQYNKLFSKMNGSSPEKILCCAFGVDITPSSVRRFDAEVAETAEFA